MEKTIYKGQEVKSGDWFSCKIGTIQAEGRIYFSEESEMFFLMQNTHNGATPIEGLQYDYRYSWGLSKNETFTEYGLNAFQETDLIITPYTEVSDPITTNYVHTENIAPPTTWIPIYDAIQNTDKKEFKWGDKVVYKGDIFKFVGISPSCEGRCFIETESSYRYTLLSELAPYQRNTHTLPDGRVIDLDTLEEKNFIK